MASGLPVQCTNPVGSVTIVSGSIYMSITTMDVDTTEAGSANDGVLLLPWR